MAEIYKLFAAAVHMMIYTSRGPGLLSPKHLVFCCHIFHTALYAFLNSFIPLKAFSSEFHSCSPSALIWRMAYFVLLYVRVN